MAEMLVNETNVLKFLREKVEPQQLDQIIAHFHNQNTDAIKRIGVVLQLLKVLETSTKSGVIQEVNKFYYANTHVDDVRRIMMDQDDWFRATPNEGVQCLPVHCPTQVPKTMIKTLGIQIADNKDV